MQFEGHYFGKIHPGPNQVWTMDFVSDQLSDGRKIGSLTIVDIFTRESLAMK